jgi:uncharacterized protein YuzE
MRRRTSPRKAIAGALALARVVKQLPASSLWLDFDEEVDVLYISLKKPQRATETVEVEGEGTLLRYCEKKLVGIDVLDASTR